MVARERRRGRSRESANWNRRGIIALFVMRRWRLGSQLASSFDHGRLCRHPHPPPPFSHTAVYVPKCFRTHKAHVAGQDGVLFNDAKRRRLSLLAYFRSFIMSRSTTPSFYVQTHIPAHTRAHAYASFHHQHAGSQSLKMKPRAF